MRIARRAGQVALLIVLLLIGAVAALAGIVPVQTVLTVVRAVTGGMVQARGASGWLNALHVAHFELHDANGAWLVADDVTIDWHPYRLLFKDVDVTKLVAGHLQVRRLPASQPAQPGQASSGGGLPVRIEVRALQSGRVDLGAPVVGQAGSFTLDGSLALPRLDRPTTHLVARRLDGGGTYNVDLALGAERIDGTVRIAEPAGGFIAQLAKLPALGALSLDAHVAGPRSALGVTAKLAAGPLEASANGTVDLTDSTLDLAVTGSAPSMHPAPDIAWQAMSLQAAVKGKFTAPDASGTLTVAQLSAAGAAVQRFTATMSGNSGAVQVHAEATGVTAPLPKPDLFASAPFVLDATARLDQPGRPVTFHLSHPLVDAQGQGRTEGSPEVAMTLTVPQFAPFATLAGIALEGESTVRLHAAMSGDTATLSGDGTVGIRSGLAPASALIGDGAALSFAMNAHGQDIAIDRFRLEGQGLSLTADGSKQGDRLTAHLGATLPKLDLLAPTLTGSLRAQLAASGTFSDLAGTAHVTGEVGAPGIRQGPITVDVAAKGLPNAPSGTITAQGQLAGAPLQLALAAKRAGDALDFAIQRADWRSLHADGALEIPAGSAIPLGKLSLRLGNLGDLRPFVGQPLTGSVTATLQSDRGRAVLSAELRDAGVPGTKVGQGTLQATLRDPLGSPKLDAKATLAGIEAGSVRGSAQVSLAGPQNALSIRTDASLVLSGTPATIAGAATLDVPAKRVQLSSMQLATKGQTVRLLQPATINFAGPVTVNRLAFGSGTAVLALSGRLSPTLDATVTLRTPADIAASVSPALALAGQIAMDATLRGTPAAPEGRMRLTANGIRARTGPARAMPPANLLATLDVRGKSAQVDARLTAGSARLVLAGQAPLGSGPMTLRAQGGLDLALLDPILTAQGERARGRVSLDATIGGTLAAPRIGGTARLANGDIQDFNQGLRIHGLTATVEGAGDTVRLVSLTGKAGSGTISAHGTASLGAAGLPVDLVLVARDASPIQSDMLQMTLDANLTLRGNAAAELAAGGTVTIRRANVQIPSGLPPSIAKLNVIRPGEKPAAPSKGPQVRLDLTIDAPGQIFVRGRGVDAELAGRLRVAGEASKPRVSGGFEMRRGDLSVAGQTLDFTHGKVGFDGTGPGGTIDPTLDFVASTTSNNVTATLTIGGYASKPTIQLTSTPPLPQDEVLAYLLFRISLKDIGPFQIAAIASSLAELTGGGGGFNPLGSLRSGLGLDRLSVGGSSTGSGATVQAGKYVSRGVYVGATQGTSSSTGTGATVQIDITRGLKLETDVGSARGDNKVGLTYQFEY